MTVPSSVAKSGPYICNGVTDVFNYDFRIVDKSHLNVILTDANGAETSLTLTTHYTVSDVGSDTGSINLTAAGVALAITGTTLTILRNPPFTQETDLQNQGAYLAQTVEDRFDLLTMQIQTVKERSDRSIAIAASDEDTTLDDLTADLVKVAARDADIGTVAGISADVSTVAGVSDDVTTVAGIADQLPDLAGVVLETATDASTFSFVLDEDDMASDSDKKVPTQQSVNQGKLQKVATRTAMKGLDGAKHLAVYLMEAGREGTFKWDGSDLSTEVTADTAEGIYVAPSSDTTGASGAWVRQGGWRVTGVRPEWFGAAADGTTDDAAAVEAAAGCLGTSGGLIRLDPTKDYYVSDLTLPSMCVIDGGHAHFDTYNDGVTYTGQGTFRFHKGLVLASTGTITLLASAGLQNVFCKRSGWAYTDTDATDYAGTFVTVSGYGGYLRNVMAIGFNKLVSCPDPGQSRLYIDKFYGDGVNGFDLDRSADATRIYDVHLWPFGTIEGYTADGATDSSMLVRAGTALKMRDGAAGMQLDNFFALGYATGLDIANLSTLNAGRVRVEIPSDQATDSIGFKIGGAVDQVYFASLTASGYEKGIQINSTSTNQVNVGYLECHLGSGTVVECLSGSLTIGEYYGRDRDGIIFDVQATNILLNVVKGRHRTGTGTITDYLKVVTNTPAGTVNVNLRTDAAAGTSIVSGTHILPGTTDTGGVISLPADPSVDVIVVTSSVTLTTINGGWAGRRIVIKFTQARSADTSGNILSALTIAAGQMIEFVYDGSKWCPL